MKALTRTAEHLEVSHEMTKAVDQAVRDEVVQVEQVRLLPQDPRDMVPSAVRWARAVLADIAQVPRKVMQRPARTSMTAVVWVLAAAADFDDRIPPDHTAARLASEAEVGTRVWQKRTAWLRTRGWLTHGPSGRSDGWQLSTP